MSCFPPYVESNLKNGSIAIINIAAELGGALSSKDLDHDSLSQPLLNRGESYCKTPSDASADRFSRAEVGVVLVLKPLNRAVEDGDHIYATILGTGIDNSDLVVPVNTPAAEAQRDVMRRAWTQSGGNPSECDYVEVHASGTAADRHNVNWVAGSSSIDGALSVMDDIGDTETVAFLASLKKVLGIIKTGLITPLAIQNPGIPWDRRALRVAHDVVPNPILPDSRQALISFASSSRGGEDSHGKTMLDSINTLLEVFIEEFSPDVPCTACGLDSISAAKMPCFLRLFVVDMTFHDLAKCLRNRNVSHSTEASPTVGLSSKDEMEVMIKKYSSDFFETNVNGQSSTHSKDSEIVVLTGSTGGLGTAILVHLFEMPTVTRIYAINRPDPQGAMSLEQRQSASLKQRGYDAAILQSSKVVLVEARLEIPGFGIPRETFNEIKASVTSIIHCAWPVNWSMRLALFEDSIRGLRNLIDIALSSASPARLLFVSSILVVLKRTSPFPAPEQPIISFENNTRIGYVEAKWVAERILEKAATMTKLRPVVVRPGQITGAPNGAWNPAEWFPRVVRSVPYLGCLPGGDEDVSWISLHDAAKAVIEMRDSPFPILHIVNPNPISWSVLSKPLAEKLSVPTIPYSEWLTLLEKSAVQNRASVNGEGAVPVENGHGLNSYRVPALAVIDVLRVVTSPSPAREAFGLPRLDVQLAMKVSPSLRNAKRLTSDDALRWLPWWRLERRKRQSRL